MPHDHTFINLKAAYNGNEEFNTFVYKIGLLTADFYIERC